MVHAVAQNAVKTNDDSAENEIPSKPADRKDAATTTRPALTKKSIDSERALNHFVPGVFDVHDLENEEVKRIEFVGNEASR